MSEQLPDPPTDLTQLAAGDVKTIPAGSRLARVVFTAGDHPMTWRQMRTYGPTRSRFDHHPPPPRDHVDGPKISYWAATAELTPTPSNPLCAVLAEVFAETRTVELSRNEPWFVVIEVGLPLRLLDVSDSMWIVRNRGNAAISSGRRNTARAWARKIHATYHDIDGIWYQTSNCPPARSIALNERAQGALPARPTGAWPLTHPGLRARIETAADTIGYQVI